MSGGAKSFEKRLRTIVRTHERMSAGAVHVMRPDGLVVARPRLYKPRFPLRGLVLLLCAAVLFKGFIFASLGALTYSERLASLGQGTLIEQAGAWLMQPDPVTLAIADVLTRLGLTLT